MTSDRILGLVVVIGALAFFAGALQIQTSFLSDPLGPRVFPLMIAVAALLCGLTILWRPDAEPDWPARRNWLGMGIALVVLVGYAYTIVPGGFLISTALAAAAISYLITPRLGPALLTGAGLSALLFAVFKYGLGLGLVALPRALIG